MTRQAMMGFEAGSVEVLNASYGATISATLPRTGTYSLYLDSDDSYGTVVTPSDIAEAFLRVGIYYINDPPAWPGALLSLWDSWGVVNVALFVERVTRLLVLWRGDLVGGSPLAVGSTPIPYNQWVCVEVHAIIADSGSCQVKVDGFLDIDFAGDTSNGGTTNVRAVLFGWDGSNDVHPEMCIDDIAINDALGLVNNSWIGREGIYGIVSDGAGNYTQLQASAGNAWDCINEVPPDDGDYVYSDTVDQKSTYTMTSLLPVTGTIACINVIMRAQLSAAGTGNIARLIRSNGVDSQGSDVGLDVTAKTIQEIIETDPSGGGAWTIARVNALEAGAVVR